MNCKPGDLAIVVSEQSPQHTGKVVTVVRAFDRNSWICTPWLRTTRGQPIAWCDCALRPIRDNDKEDETLTWAGKPAKEIA